MFLSNLLLSLLFLFIIIFEFTRKKTFIFDGLFFFHVWFIMSYVLSPFLINNFGENFTNPLFYVRTNLGDIIPILIILVFYTCFLLGYHLRINKKKFKTIMLVENKKSKNFIIFLALIIVSTISILGFIGKYGGIENVIENVNTIRGGQTERNTLGAFLNLFTVYINYAVWLGFAMILLFRKNKIKIKRSFIFLVILILIISISWGLMRGSRGGLLQIFLMMYLIAVFINEKFHIKYILSFIFLGFIVLLYGKDFFYVLSIDLKATFIHLKESFNNSDMFEKVSKVLQNFSYPYMSLNMSLDLVGNEISVRWFKDIPYSIIFYFQIFGYDAPTTITYINTYFALGRYESNIPPGLMAFLWYSLKLPGVIIGGIVFGYFLRVINQLFYQLTYNKNPLSIVIYLVIVTKIGESIFYGDPRVLIIQSFSFFILLTMYLLFYTKLKFVVKRGQLPNDTQGT